MDPEVNPSQTFAFGGGATETVLHPAVLVAMLLAIGLMLVLPRRYVAVPFLLCVFLTPLGQQVYIGGVHLLVMRILILAGWLRLLREKLNSSKPLLVGGFNSLDKFLLAWALFHATAVMLLWQEKGAIVNQIGFLWNVVGGYFLMRALIQDVGDIRRVIKTFVVIAVIMSAAMINEQLSGRNVFGILGGVNLQSFVRDGRIRSGGAFQHPILAGTFGATLLPLLYWLWHGGKAKLFAAVGIVAALAMILTSASSTPFMAVGAGFLALCLWPLRNRMRLIRWGLVLSVVGLHIVMKAPVWFLINRIDVIGASSGWHRALLIDTFIRHIGDWWLIGTNQTFEWGWDMWDMSNQFVNEGQTGGLAALACFILLIAWAFRRVGRARKATSDNRRKEWFFWFLGAALLAHVVAYFGITYFDQTQIAWFALLAMISAASATLVSRPKKPAIVAELTELTADQQVPAPKTPVAISSALCQKP